MSGRKKNLPDIRSGDKIPVISWPVSSLTKDNDLKSQKNDLIKVLLSSFKISLSAQETRVTVMQILTALTPMADMSALAIMDMRAMVSIAHVLMNVYKIRLLSNFCFFI